MWGFQDCQDRWGIRLIQESMARDKARMCAGPDYAGALRYKQTLQNSSPENLSRFPCKQKEMSLSFGFCSSVRIKLHGARCLSNFLPGHKQCATSVCFLIYNGLKNFIFLTVFAFSYIPSRTS